VDNSLAKTRQRTGALAVDKSQKAATYPPRTPLPTSPTGASRFDSKFEVQNRKFRLIPLLELTEAAQPGRFALHFATDFVGHPFRENAHPASLPRRCEQNHRGRSVQPIEFIHNLTGQ
jgi:hypothetical protein